MQLNYNILPDVYVDTDKKLKSTINELETIKVNLINEIIQPYMINDDTDNKFNTSDYKIQNEIRYNNYLIPGPFVGEPNHRDIDEGVIIKYGMGDLWVRAVAKVGKWYQNNVETCNTDKKYDCDLFPFNYEAEDTNINFFKTCLLYYTYSIHSDKFASIKDADFKFSDFTEDGIYASLFRSLEFKFIDVDAEHLYEIEYDVEELQMGDITINIDENCGEVYFGQWKEIEQGGGKISEWGDNKKHNFTAMSWNVINNNKDYNYGMPCPIKQSKYNVVLRYIGYNGL